MITTKEYQLTPKELFWTSLRYGYKRLLLYLLMIFIVCQFVYLYFTDWNIKLYLRDAVFSNIYLLIYFAVIILISFIARYYGLRSPKNKIYFQPIYFEIDDKFIKGTRSSGTKGTYSWDDVIKFKKMKDRYLLFISKAAAIHLPFDIFKSKKDLQKFEETLKAKKLIN